MLALSTAGCFTTTRLSTVGPFVRTIGRARDELLVESCTIQRAEQTHHNALNFFLNLQPDHELAFTADACGAAFVSLGAEQAPSPPREVIPR